MTKLVKFSCAKEFLGYHYFYEMCKRTSTKQAVVNVIFRLRNRDKKLDTFSNGSREKYIALKGWFEKPGVIKKTYAARFRNQKIGPPMTMHKWAGRKT